MLSHYEELARAIVAKGAQLTLPYDHGDCTVTFSRRELVRLIREALEEAHEDV